MIIEVKDLEHKPNERGSEEIGATFHDTEVEQAAYGLRASISWDAGIELITPLPGRDSEIKRRLETQGDGLAGVVFMLDDVEQAREAAERSSIVILFSEEFTSDQIEKHLQCRYKRFKEYMLDPTNTHGIPTVLGQFDPK